VINNIIKPAARKQKTTFTVADLETIIVALVEKNGLVHPRDYAPTDSEEEQDEEDEDEEQQEEEDEDEEEDKPTVVPPTHGQNRCIKPIAPALSLQQRAGHVTGTMAAWYEQRDRPVPEGIRIQAHAPQEPAHQPPNMNMEVDDPRPGQHRFSPERFGLQIDNKMRSLSRSLSPLSPSPLPSPGLAASMQKMQIQSSAAKASAPKQQGATGKENVRTTRSQAKWR